MNQKAVDDQIRRDIEATIVQGMLAAKWPGASGLAMDQAMGWAAGFSGWAAVHREIRWALGIDCDASLCATPADMPGIEAHELAKAVQGVDPEPVVCTGRRDARAAGLLTVADDDHRLGRFRLPVGD